MTKTDTKTIDTDTDISKADAKKLEQARKDAVTAELRSYGLAGEPVSYGPARWETIIGAIRAANLNPDARGGAVALLKVLEPDVNPDDVILKHAPTGEFDVKAEGKDSLTATVTDKDADLELPPDNVSWDYGDNGKVYFDSTSPQRHTYASPGKYLITKRVVVAGMVYSVGHEVEVGTVNDDTPAEVGTHPPTEQQGTGKIIKTAGFNPDSYDLPPDNPDVPLITAINLPENPYTGRAYDGPDPADFSEAEVVKIIENDKDLLRTQALLSLEVAGKNRPSLVKKLEAAIEEFAVPVQTFDVDETNTKDTSVDKETIDAMHEGLEWPPEGTGKEGVTGPEADPAATFDLDGSVVADVNKYADEHADDTVELKRLLKAEKAGKARAGVISHLESLIG